jgi:thymidylate kinase
LPFVRAGENVILDRWWPSTYAYQGANNVEPDMIMSLMRSTTPPEFRGDNVLMFYLSLPIETAMQRSGVFSQGGGPETGNDRFEKEGVEFQRKLEARYRILVLMGLMREVRVDQFSSEKETAEFLWHNYIEQELA